MTEIGGYIELDTYSLPMRHDGALALNCGRNCLAYLIEARQIRKIALPCFLCDSVRGVCERYGVTVWQYHIGNDFLPKELSLDADEWLYLVNYYGQLTAQQMEEYAKKHPRIIIDNAQAYFDEPLSGVDTIYTCRKFFGVADGAFLYTDAKLDRELPQDESFDRMRFVLGRFERTASEFYAEASANNRFFETEPIKRMSKLTENLLHAIDYAAVKRRRTENYAYLADKLDGCNRLKLRPIEGAFAYPLWLENGAEVRKQLIEQKIYIPTLWPNVRSELPPDSLEYDMANNILPLPCDQRYGIDEMKRIAEEISHEY